MVSLGVENFIRTIKALQLIRHGCLESEPRHRLFLGGRALYGVKAHTELSVSRTKAEVKSHNAIQASKHRQR